MTTRSAAPADGGSRRAGSSSCTARGRAPGTRYRYRIDGEHEVPDPASRCNPDDVTAPSEVVDPRRSTGTTMTGAAAPGTRRSSTSCTSAPSAPEGTFAGAATQLDHLVRAGRHRHRADADRRFSRPARLGLRRRAALRARIGVRHAGGAQGPHRRRPRRGIAVMLDVVYNHFGPEGNYLHAVRAAVLHRAAPDPVGRRHQLRRPTQPRRCATSSSTTRCTGSRSITSTACGSMPFTPSTTTASRTSSTSSRSAVARRPGRERHIYLVLENGATQARSSAPGRTRHAATRSGTTTFTTACTSSSPARRTATTRTTRESACHALPLPRGGLRLPGRELRARGRRARGEPSAHLPPTAFVNFLQNHDQIGNRAFGERLSHTRDATKRRCARRRPCCCWRPRRPCCSWARSGRRREPFPYFCDFEPRARAGGARRPQARVRQVRAVHRRRAAAAIPDPTDPRHCRVGAARLERA